MSIHPGWARGATVRGNGDDRRGGGDHPCLATQPEHSPPVQGPNGGHPRIDLGSPSDLLTAFVVVLIECLEIVLFLRATADDSVGSVFVGG